MTTPDELKTNTKDAENQTGVIPANDDNSLEGLIGRLKERDKDDLKALWIMVGLFAVFVVIYLSAMSRSTGLMKTGYLLLVGGFLYTLLYFFSKLQAQKKIDYSEPVVTFLRKAEKRYSYWPVKDFLLVIPSCVALTLGGGILVYASFDKYFPGSIIPVAIFSLVFAAAFLIGHFAGKKQWRKSKQDLYEKIRAMRKEFGE